MGLPVSELVKFPVYFGYDLDTRIRPRFERLRDIGVKISLNRMLSLTKAQFEKKYGGPLPE